MSTGQSRSPASLLLSSSEWALSLSAPWAEDLDLSLWWEAEWQEDTSGLLCRSLSFCLLQLHVQPVLCPDLWPFLSQDSEHPEEGRRGRPRGRRGKTETRGGDRQIQSDKQKEWKKYFLKRVERDERRKDRNNRKREWNRWKESSRNSRMKERFKMIEKETERCTKAIRNIENRENDRNHLIMRDNEGRTK